MASREMAVMHLNKALSILDSQSSDVAACHVQLAIDLILSAGRGRGDSEDPHAAAVSVSA